jgi:sulfoxide reductase catalytic subunit YedY
MTKINPSEITPEHVYLSRRKFMVGIGALVTSSLVLSACGGQEPSPIPTSHALSEAEGTPPLSPPPSPDVSASPSASPDISETPVGGLSEAEISTDELGQALTSFEAITSYTNYYEFTTSKEGVARLAQDFRSSTPSPWTVEVGGLVHKPKTFDIDDLRGLPPRFPQEERIYRLRCVEAWSMVIPWVGFPLANLLKEVDPMSSAKYVRFETLYDPDQMPGQKRGGYNWPYVEGLRMDEAMHDLTILATGLYGKSLLPQNGTPVRLVVPWKYGFKSIKSIVRIDLVEEMPVSLWMAAAPHEYGFYANVNPDVPHPRWSQATERRIGETKRRETLLFNGYAKEVADLYAGMDLKEWY